jgi:hypothetical protein
MNIIVHGHKAKISYIKFHSGRIVGYDKFRPEQYEIGIEFIGSDDDYLPMSCSITENIFDMKITKFILDVEEAAARVIERKVNSQKRVLEALNAEKVMLNRLDSFVKKINAIE